MNSVVIKATVMWASLQKVNEMSNKYQVELTNLSPEDVDKLKDLDLEAKENPKKPEKGFFITCKSKHPIKALDKNGDSLAHVAVGNGSKATAVISYYDWKFKNKTGRSPSCWKLIINDLVVWEPNVEPEETASEDQL